MTWHSRLKQQGVDFVKVDNQSSLNSYLGGELSVAKAANDIHSGLEASVALNFNNCMINCMGMASENIWNRPVTSVSRSGNDFLPKIFNGFGEHAIQNVYNSVYHGQFYWGDWDMFWTDHHDAIPHMILRAVSGGPVYFSDRLGKTRPDIIWPLIYSNGRIIRCDSVGQPTVDTLTVNTAEIPVPLKVWNMSGSAGVLAAFHVFNGDLEVKGETGPEDIPGLSGENYLLFDAIRKTARKIKLKERLSICLKPFEAEMFLFIPADTPFIAIGLANKLVAADSVLQVSSFEQKTMVYLKDEGDFYFVSEKKPVRASVNQQPADIEELDQITSLYRIICINDSERDRDKIAVEIEY